MNITEIVTPDRVLSGVEAASKKRVLEEMSEVLASGDSRLGVQAVFDCLCARERLGSTGLGSGVALPHARVSGLARAIGAFIRLAEPVDFDAPDGEKVDLVFGMLVPDEAAAEHLGMLAQLAESLDNADVRKRLRESAGAGEVIDLLGRAALAA